MQLITKTIEKKFEKYPLYSQDGKGLDAVVLVKIFNPYGHGTWLITEASKQDDEWIAFGYAEMYGKWEWGYISLTELQDVRIKVFGCAMTLERDLHCEGQTVRECLGLPEE